jgi:hypothetical protein
VGKGWWDYGKGEGEEIEVFEEVREGYGDEGQDGFVLANLIEKREGEGKIRRGKVDLNCVDK